MKISSRLLIVLVPAVAGIMALYAYWAVQQREALLLEQSEADARVFSTAISVAFTHAFRDLQYQDAQEMLGEIDAEPSIYGIVFYDTEGTPTIRSETIGLDDVAPSSTIRAVLDGGGPLVTDRDVGGERGQSIFRTVRGRDGEVTGVLEVAQPLTYLEGERAVTAGRFFLNTVTLLLALTFLLTWLVRRHVARPLDEFVGAIRDLGEGDLSRRLDEGPEGSELAAAAGEFNRMVGRLREAMDEAERETEERLALEKKMREREHLAAIGTLAAGVAHQLGTPLSVIGGRADVVLQRGKLSSKDARSLQIIVEQANRITRIVRNLLQFARRPEPALRPVEVGAVIDRSLELFAPDFEEAGIEVKVEEGPEGLAWVESDPDLLEEVLVTLLENALHALREPGAEPRLRVSVTAAGPGTTLVEIRDGGPGIASEALGKMCEPFFTTRTGGTGLGLAVSRGILKQLGGRLDVVNVAELADGEATSDSDYDLGPLRGAAARVFLPSIPAPAHPSHSVEARSS